MFKRYVVPFGRGWEWGGVMKELWSCEVLYDFEGLVALNKGAGVLSHPNVQGKADPQAVLRASYDKKTESYLLGDGSRIFLLHRLDKETSGVLLFARNESLAQVMKMKFKNGEIRKVYRAWILGKYPKKSDVWSDCLERKRVRGALKIVKVPGRANAKTEMKVLRYNGDLHWTEIQLEPQTGRTHQLRVQASVRGFPIVGDPIYGDFEMNRKHRKKGFRRLFLHAASLEFSIRAEGKSKKILIQAPTPQEFSLN